MSGARGRAGAIGTLLVASAAIAVIAGTGMRLEAVEKDPERELLYIPSGKALGMASLGNEPLMADLVYLWAIQFYGEPDIADRYEYLEMIFTKVIAELDPHYIDPYWIGALIMSIETRDLDAALRLLDRGIENNPDEWILPYLAGWECYHAKQFDRAVGYFEKAVNVPGAPAAIRRSYAAMFQRLGDVPTALAAWREVLEDPDNDERGREIARRRVYELTIELHVQTLERTIAAFRERHGGPPRALGDLVAAGLIDRVPVDPDGNPYGYRPATGEIVARRTAVLGDR